MTAGLLQLVAQGNEDLYLTLNPEITFFKTVYKRHTNFSIESVPQNLNVQADFGRKVTCTLGKNADLINKIYIVVVLPQINYFQESIDLPNLNKCAWIENIGWNIINYIEIEIGGYIINRHYTDWLKIWTELIDFNNDEKSRNIMLGNVPSLTNFTNSKDGYTLYIPLYFWFCRNAGLSLPIIALEFSDVKINIDFMNLTDVLLLSPTNYINITNNFVHFKEGDILFQEINNIKTYIKYFAFNSFNTNDNRLYYNKISNSPIISSSNINNNYSIYSLDKKYNVTIQLNAIETNHINMQKNFAWINSLSISNVYLLIDYIYLDVDERIKFINSEHEYLIDILIYDNDKIITNNSTKIKLSYSQPCKELIFRAQMDYLIVNNLLDKSNYCLDYLKTKNIINYVEITMNGQNRLTQRKSDYFNLIQPFQHHYNILPKGIYSYSFSLYPEEHQPSGTCNLSKIDDFQIIINVDKSINYSNPAKFRVYALCINVLRIINGQGGLAFI